MKNQDRLFKKFGQVFPAGTILFQEGQACTGMYIIQKGRVRLYKQCGQEEITIDFLGEGDFFGEMACLTGRPRSIHAIVEEESQILIIQPELLEELIRENAGLGLKLMGNMASRLKKAYEIIENLTAERRQTMGREVPSS